MDRFKNYDNDVRQCVTTYEETIRNHQQRYFDVDELEIVIDFYLDQNDIENLETAVRYAEQLYPEHNSIKLRRSHLLCAHGDFNKALSLLKELNQLEPDNTDVHYALGTVYGYLDQPQRAIHHYQLAAADQYRLDIIYSNIGDEYMKLHKIDDAIKYFKKAMAIDEHQDFTAENLVLCYNELGQIDKAIRYLTDYVREHPYSDCSWGALGNAYLFANRYNEAAEAYEYALVIDKTVFSYYAGLSDSYLCRFEYSKAASVLLDGIDYSDDKSMVYHQIGSIYFDTNNYHTAVIYFHKALSVDPYMDSSYHSLALSYEQMGDIANAICAVKQAISINPMEAHYHLTSGILHEKQSDNDIAESEYRLALELDNSTCETWLSLSDFLFSTQRYEEAAQLLEEAANTIDPIADLYTLWAASLFMAGHNSQFLSVVQIAHKYYGNDPKWDAQLIKLCPECIRLLSTL
ncbi:MAG: tetratricopeptide repeat protein [Bacteroidales bacterium]|nr:tetratricopeptide repeat protein [Candidatus Colimorpha onthohippi]